MTLSTIGPTTPRSRCIVSGMTVLMAADDAGGLIQEEVVGRMYVLPIIGVDQHPLRTRPGGRPHPYRARRLGMPDADHR